ARLLASAAERNAELEDFLAQNRISPVTSFLMLKLTREQAAFVMSSVSEALEKGGISGLAKSGRSAAESLVLQRLKGLGVRTHSTNSGGEPEEPEPPEAPPAAKAPKAKAPAREKPEAPPGCQVFVKNLDKSTGEPELRDLFGRQGTVRDVELATEEGTSVGKGCAIVLMSRKREAKQCVKALNFTKPWGRALIVEREEGAEDSPSRSPSGDKPQAAKSPE
ncbi:unnamed protein product, partial [Effrenium voratum]